MGHLTCPLDKTLLVQVGGNLQKATILWFDWQPTLKDLFCSQHSLDERTLHFVVLLNCCSTAPSKWMTQFAFIQNVFAGCASQMRALQFVTGCCLCPTELLGAGCGSPSHRDNPQQLHVLAGVWWRLCVRVLGRKRLPELFLLLRRVQRRSVEKGPCAHRHFGTRCILPRLLSHVFPIVQYSLLGRLLVSLAALNTSQRKDLNVWCRSSRQNPFEVRLKKDQSCGRWTSPWKMRQRYSRKLRQV